MLEWFQASPGRIYVAATLLPLAAFVLLLIGGGVRNLCRPYRRRGGALDSLYWVCGGDRPLKAGAYLATGVMVVVAGLAIAGLTQYLAAADNHKSEPHWAERVEWVRIGPPDVSSADWPKMHANDPSRPAPKLAAALEVGYRIDHLTALIFAMVAVISTLIFIFSLGYMSDETSETVEDHEVDQQRASSSLASGGGLGATAHFPHVDPEPHAGHEPDTAVSHTHAGHFARRGRYGRFFLYLSLFCFSMLNLVIADNLFQVFVSWELVGVCSFFLIGFYYERPSAARAANKAFIVNRIGDAGFIIGILIAWTYLGTLNFEEMFHRVRAPGQEDVINAAQPRNQLVRVAPSGNDPRTFSPSLDGSHLGLFPIIPPSPSTPGSPDGKKLYRQYWGFTSFTAPATGTIASFGAIPYWLFVVMGIGIFLGCVGKSAQVPLHTWLPDAMEGPTPVSALIHAATMVAAGVYLVGRCFPLFAPEVLLVIAYTGAVTLFISATIALVQTDIKRILAYSTCSQLGYMMLALGVGGWLAGLMHLITHAFFKALLFLGSGSVILGCHHEQDVRKMGGLRRKMPITAFTMLMGVLAICGMPFFSGWYSKDQIIAAAMGFGLTHRAHLLLLVLPVATAGLTAFYMFRLWFLTFAGKPRDEHVHEHARESPWVMTVPLILLAAFSVGVAWGWPFWDAESSALRHVLERAEPAALKDAGHLQDVLDGSPFPMEVPFAREQRAALHNHVAAEVVALLMAILGVSFAYFYFGRAQPTREALYSLGNKGYRFLLHKWYFDEAYDAAFVKPTVGLARTAAALDKRPTDGPPPPGEAELPPKRFDFRTLDGILNAVGQGAAAAGRSLRRVQTGSLRTYILALALTTAILLAILVSS